MRLRTWPLALAAVSVLLASADKKPPIEKTSNEFVEIAGTLLDKDEIVKDFGSDLGGNIVVVRVTVRPLSEKPVKIDYDDFFLLDCDNGQRSAPYEASQIAGTSVLVVTPTGARRGGMLGDPYANSLSSLIFFNKGGRRGLCDYNIAHNFVLNYLWQVPAPSFGGGITRRLLGGWELGGVLVASTGAPFTLTIGGDPLGQNSTDAKSFVSRVAGPGCGGNPVNSGSVTNYIKLNCFSDPMAPASFANVCQPASDGKGGFVPGTCMNLFGNNGRNTVVGPGLINVDFSVFKNNYIETSSGNINVQIRGEFFNVINHANFQSPIANSTLFNQDGSPTNGAGAINSTSTPSRQIQLGLKVIW